MPSPDAPIPDLSSQLFSLLLGSAGWLLLAALVVAASTWGLGRYRPDVMARLSTIVFGADEQVLTEPPARRFVRVSFGLLWILDGLLQAQPRMPGGFVSTVVEPQVTSSPSWLAAIAEPLATVWTKHPVAADAVTVVDPVAMHAAVGWVLVTLGGVFLISLGIVTIRQVHK